MYCPLCRKNVEKWLPYNNRSNALCPNCKCLERHRLTGLFFEKYNFKYDNILHIAPEGKLKNLFTNISKNYVCGDINPKKYRHLNAMYLDATHNPFKNEVFHCIYASHILEHIVDDKKAMSEMYRVLKKKGVLITLVPQKFSLEKTYEDFSIVTPEDRKRTFGQWDHVRYYGCDFSKKLKDIGFYVKIFYNSEQEEIVNKMEFDEKHIINSDGMEKFGFNIGDLLYVCEKN